MTIKTAYDFTDEEKSILTKAYNLLGQMYTDLEHADLDNTDLSCFIGTAGDYLYLILNNYMKEKAEKW